MKNLKKLRELRFHKELGWAIVIIAIIAVGAVIFFNRSQTKKTPVKAPATAATCVASDANLSPADAIYVKGTVTSVDSTGNVQNLQDDCINATYLEKFICYESPVGSGKFAGGRTVVKCANGCIDGACKK